MREVVVGIDIGGTNTVLGLVDAEGACLAEASIPTCPREGASKLVARLAGKIRDLQAPVSGQSAILGIGIGAPDANYYRGTIEDPPNLGWKGVTPLVALFKEHFDIPVVVTND